MKEKSSALQPKELALYFSHARFSYGGAPVVTDVTGDVKYGEALAVIGPNGSGKTTLLRGILGELKIQGSVSVVGCAPGKAPQGALGYVPQIADLDANFPVTVAHVVAMGCYAELGWYRRCGARYKRRIADALDRVGMRALARRPFSQLSGGQRQRVLVARAIVARPHLIIFDEPFNGLDEPSRQALVDIIVLLKKDGVAVVTSTHDAQLIYGACEKVLVLSGRQIAFGEVKDVMNEENLGSAFGQSHNFSMISQACGEHHGK